MLHGGPKAVARRRRRRWSGSSGAIARAAARAGAGVAARACSGSRRRSAGRAGVAAAAAVVVLIPVLGALPPRLQPRGGEVPVALREGSHGTPSSGRPVCARSASSRPVQALDAEGRRAAAIAPRSSSWRCRTPAVPATSSSSAWTPTRFQVVRAAPARAASGWPRRERHRRARRRVGAARRQPRAGPVRIYALFSDSPVTTPEVEAATPSCQAHSASQEARAAPIERCDVLQRSRSSRSRWSRHGIEMRDRLMPRCSCAPARRTARTRIYAVDHRAEPHLDAGVKPLQYADDDGVKNWELSRSTPIARRCSWCSTTRPRACIPKPPRTPRSPERAAIFDASRDTTP